MKFSREIELRGHIVDSGILAKVMDTVVEYMVILKQKSSH